MMEELAARLGVPPIVLQGALGIAAASVLLGFLGRAQRRRRREALDQRLGPAASAQGIRYHPEGGAAPGMPGAGQAQSAGDALAFSGSVRGLSWRAEVEQDPAELRNVRRAAHERTRVTFAVGALAPGRFVLVMALPQGRKRWEGAAPQGDGFLATVGRKVMESAVDLYAGAYFGARHRALVNIAGAQVVPAPEGFWVLANDEAAALRLLGGETPRLLAALRAGEAGPFRGRPLHSFGLLLSPEGLTLGCQVAVTEPAAVRELAGWAAGVAEQARGL
ncbi:MAG: hypothetical protein HZB56_06670 [Deltaproteobacteria bacterium]|nr:hypothetical protein [Deltaproteobacteria bacterium]